MKTTEIISVPGIHFGGFGLIRKTINYEIKITPVGRNFLLRAIYPCAKSFVPGNEHSLLRETASTASPQTALWSSRWGAGLNSCATTETKKIKSSVAAALAIPVSQYVAVGTWLGDGLHLKTTSGVQSGGFEYGAATLQLGGITNDWNLRISAASVSTLGNVRSFLLRMDRSITGTPIRLETSLPQVLRRTGYLTNIPMVELAWR